MRATRLWNYAFAPTLRTVEPAAFLHDGGLWGVFALHHSRARSLAGSAATSRGSARSSPLDGDSPLDIYLCLRAAHSVAVKFD